MITPESKASRGGKGKGFGGKKDEHNFVWGNVDVNFRAHQENFARYASCIREAIINDGLREHISGPIIADYNDLGHKNQLREEEPADEDDLELQQRLFKEARLRQARLMEMNEVERRRAKPVGKDVAILNEITGENQEQIQEVKSLLTDVSFDSLKLPILMERGGESIVRYSLFVQPLLDSNNVQCIHKGDDLELDREKSEPKIASDDAEMIEKESFVSRKHFSEPLIELLQSGSRELYDHPVLDASEVEGLDYSLVEQIPWDDFVCSLQEVDVSTESPSERHLTFYFDQLAAHKGPNVDSKKKLSKLRPNRSKIRFTLTKPTLKTQITSISPPTSNNASNEKGWGSIVLRSQERPEFPVYERFHRPNFELEGENWVLDIIWDKPLHLRPPPLIIDHNDLNILRDTNEREVQEKPQEQHDRWNISNDWSEMYKPVTNLAVVGKTDVQHALFTRELSPSIFKTKLSPAELKRFHRPLTSLLRPSPVLSVCLVARSLTAKSKTPKKFVVKKESQLFGSREGRLVLVEYIEENPCLIHSFGMASEIITFYRSKANESGNHLEPEDGRLKVLEKDNIDESPFLGEILPGQRVASLSNNMFSVPLFCHKATPTDFLLCKAYNRRTWFIRPIDRLFVAGQILPRIVVPSPNSRDATTFIKKRLAVYIYRILKTKGRVQISEIWESFGDQSESAIRGELKEVAEFQRGGSESGWWIRKATWQPPKESDLQQMVHPEEICAFEKMLVDQLWLQERGISTLKLTTRLSNTVQKMPHQVELRPIAAEIEKELQLAAWNWTGNYLWMRRGQGFLKLAGPGNPLGYGEGFCFIRAQSRALPDRTTNKLPSGTALTGTDKDLRSLPNHELKDILMEFGVPGRVVDQIDRWDRVDLVREKATDAVVAGIQTPYARFARSTRATFRSQQRQFRKDAQVIFNRHCQVLESETFVEPEESMDLDDLAKDLEDFMEGSNADLKEQTRQKRSEEVEKEAYAKLMDKMESDPKREKAKRTVLKRIVTFVREDGSHNQKVSYIRDANQIALFKRDQEEGTKLFNDNEYIETVKSRYRHLKENPKKKEKPSKQVDGAPRQRKKVTCGACGTVGHSKNSKLCPLKVTESPVPLDGGAASIGQQGKLVLDLSRLKKKRKSESTSVDEPVSKKQS